MPGTASHELNEISLPSSCFKSSSVYSKLESRLRTTVLENLGTMSFEQVLICNMCDNTQYLQVCKFLVLQVRKICVMLILNPSGTWF